MPTKRKADKEGLEDLGSIYDLLTLLRHVSECDKCRRLWRKMELHAGIVDRS